jgi:hypothetical protein
MRVVSQVSPSPQTDNPYSLVHGIPSSGYGSPSSVHVFPFNYSLDLGIVLELVPKLSLPPVLFCRCFLIPVASLTNFIIIYFLLFSLFSLSFFTFFLSSKNGLTTSRLLCGSVTQHISSGEDQLRESSDELLSSWFFSRIASPCRLYPSRRKTGTQ